MQFDERAEQLVDTISVGTIVQPDATEAVVAAKYRHSDHVGIMLRHEALTNTQAFTDTPR